MKRLKEIMQELGFDENGNQDVQKAFIKNLIKQSRHADKIKKFYPVASKKPSTQNTVKPEKGKQNATYLSKHRKTQPKQLSFDFQSCDRLKTIKASKTQAG